MIGSYHTQRGNVLLYVLVAVALLAALSVAISSSMRGDTAQVEEDRAEIIAGEIVEYSNTMSSAVAQLRLRGIAAENLCFDDNGWGTDFDYDHTACADNLNKIYHPSGAGLSWSRAPKEAMSRSDSITPDHLWHFYGDNEIAGVGTTCEEAECADLILVVDELDEMVCWKINELLGFTEESSSLPTEEDIGETRFVGNFEYSQTIGDTSSSEYLQGRLAGCFTNLGNNKNTFYKVLIAR